MLIKAKSNLNDDVLLTDNWNIVLSELKKYKSPTLVLSSVIHEVYSYTNSKTIKSFWEKIVFGGEFKYICIRDMIPSVMMDKHQKDQFKLDVEKVQRIADPIFLKSFEERWGSIESNYRTFIHFLLKYKYVDNWEREVNENYLPISLETLKTKIPQGYSIIHQENYTLKYLQDQVKKDFDVYIDHTTHIKMIIENKQFLNF